MRRTTKISQSGKRARPEAPSGKTVRANDLYPVFFGRVVRTGSKKVTMKKQKKEQSVTTVQVALCKCDEVNTGRARHESLGQNLRRTYDGALNVRYFAHVKTQDEQTVVKMVGFEGVDFTLRDGHCFWGSSFNNDTFEVGEMVKLLNLRLECTNNALSEDVDSDFKNFQVFQTFYVNCDIVKIPDASDGMPAFTKLTRSFPLKKQTFPTLAEVVGNLIDANDICRNKLESENRVPLFDAKNASTLLTTHGNNGRSAFQSLPTRNQTVRTCERVYHLRLDNPEVNMLDDWVPTTEEEKNAFPEDVFQQGYDITVIRNKNSLHRESDKFVKYQPLVVVTAWGYAGWHNDEDYVNPTPEGALGTDKGYAFEEILVRLALYSNGEFVVNHLERLGPQDLASLFSLLKSHHVPAALLVKVNAKEALGDEPVQTAMITAKQERVPGTMSNAKACMSELCYDDFSKVQTKLLDDASKKERRRWITKAQADARSDVVADALPFHVVFCAWDLCSYLTEMGLKVPKEHWETVFKTLCLAKPTTKPGPISEIGPEGVVFLNDSCVTPEELPEDYVMYALVCYADILFRTPEQEAKNVETWKSMVKRSRDPETEKEAVEYLKQVNVPTFLYAVSTETSKLRRRLAKQAFEEEYRKLHGEKKPSERSDEVETWESRDSDVEEDTEPPTKKPKTK